jgi:hypothetical protein
MLATSDRLLSCTDLGNPILHKSDDVNSWKGFGEKMSIFIVGWGDKPVAVAMPSQRSFVTLLAYNFFLRYKDTPFKNKSSPT